MAELVVVTVNDNQESIEVVVGPPVEEVCITVNDSIESVDVIVDDTQEQVAITVKDNQESISVYIIENSGITTYDGLLDTPSTKVGHGLSYPRVDPGETVHEYRTPAQTIVDLGVVSDKNFVYEQAMASATWTIAHNLAKRASVMVVDSAGTIVIGQIDYTDDNNVVLSFNAGFSGFAYFN
jgi:hypothetical protein